MKIEIKIEELLKECNNYILQEENKQTKLSYIKEIRLAEELYNDCVNTLINSGLFHDAIGKLNELKKVNEHTFIVDVDTEY